MEKPWSDKRRQAHARRHYYENHVKCVPSPTNTITTTTTAPTTSHLTKTTTTTTPTPTIISTTMALQAVFDSSSESDPEDSHHRSHAEMSNADYVPRRHEQNNLMPSRLQLPSHSNNSEQWAAAAPLDSCMSLTSATSAFITPQPSTHTKSMTTPTTHAPLLQIPLYISPIPMTYSPLPPDNSYILNPDNSFAMHLTFVNNTYVFDLS